MVIGSTGIWAILLVFAFLFRRIVPARLTLLVAVAVSMGMVACNSRKSDLKDSLQSDHTYKLVQVDLDGKISEGPQRIVKF